MVLIRLNISVCGVRETGVSFRRNSLIIERFRIYFQ